MPVPNGPLSPKSKEVMKSLLGHGAPFLLSEYRDTCHEVCGDHDPLPLTVIETRSMGIKQNPEWKAYFPPGWKCCPVVIPCDSVGRSLTADQVEGGAQLCYLLMDTAGEFKYSSLGGTQSSFTNLPAEVQSLAFIIPEDKEKAAEAYKAACMRLRELLS